MLHDSCTAYTDADKPLLLLLTFQHSCHHACRLDYPGLDKSSIADVRIISNARRPSIVCSMIFVHTMMT